MKSFYYNIFPHIEVRAKTQKCANKIFRLYLKKISTNTNLKFRNRFINKVGKTEFKQLQIPEWILANKS